MYGPLTGLQRCSKKGHRFILKVDAVLCLASCALWLMKFEIALGTEGRVDG
jgi:hypothetical protein